MDQGRGRGRGDPPGGRGRGVLPKALQAAQPAGGERARGLGALPAALGRGTPPGQSQASAPVSAPTSAPAPVGASASTSTDVERKQKVAPPAPIGLTLSDLSSALEVSTKADPLYRRPDRGTNGREIRLISNLFEIDLGDQVWYKYDVEISTAKESSVELKTAQGATNKDRIQSRRLNREIIWTLFRKHTEKLHGEYPAYDGRKTLICTRHFFDEHIFTVDMPASEYGRARQFVVKLKLTVVIDVGQVRQFYKDRRIPLNPEILQATNIVIDSALGTMFAAVNRSYYNTSSTIRGFPLTGGKELRSGIYTSTIFADWQPLLLVDKSNTAFYKSGPLIEYIADSIGMDPQRLVQGGIPQQKMSLLLKDLKGLNVKLKHAKNGRCVKINSLTEQPANSITFASSDGSSKSVADYFGETYFRLRYPFLPCITVLKANKSKTDYYPLEVCEVKENQPYKKKLNPLQTAKMIKQCQERPSARIDQAVRNVKEIKSTSMKNLSQHGVTISTEPMRTVGRQINSPTILVKNRAIQVRDGKWRQDEFHAGASLSQWMVVDCASSGPLARKLATLIFEEAMKLKLQNVCQPLNILNCTGRRTEDIFREIKKHHRDPKVPFMAVIILDVDSNYALIKRLSETTPEFTGIITQCVKGENVRTKLNPMFVGNLLKKMNAKLGGTNNSISRPIKRFSEVPFIVIGADVSHPGVGDFMTPSIAAVIGSLDNIPSKYYTEISVQVSENNNRIEYIKDLKNMAKTLLVQYYLANGQRKPRHIYYIRDGVSEGQFDEVRRREINALRDACRSLEADYRPPMTVLIAQKRHHTRFNVANEQDGGRSGNVPPGTYIDRDVVHPENFDLYMYTHQGILGTSRPTHYHLIHSDDKITTNELTELIYHLCHCYARTSSSVSIPAPVYYAHLAAYRAKEHVKADLLLTGSERQSSMSSDAPAADLSLYQKTCSVNPNFRKVLYYA